MLKYSNPGTKIGQATVKYGVLAAALVLGAGAGCEREQVGLTENELASGETSAEVSGGLVVDWNETLFEVALLADNYADPLPHLRALTMMHLAVHDAVNGVSPRYSSYALTQSDEEADPSVAAAAAAHGVLRSAYPEQRALLDAKLDESTKAAPSRDACDRGIKLGKAAAKAILAVRGHDRWDIDEPYTPKTEPGRHRFVPPFDLVYRPAWRNVEPFALARGDRFRSEPPPSLASAEYAVDYQEVKSYGAASDANRTQAQAFYADFWYELSEIGWNRVARVTWPDQEQQDLWFTARLFALVNIGLMDAYIAGWDSKMHYDFWRPYTAIRAGDTDDNATTAPDANWESYCVTPPVQDYPSTHAALGAAAATILHSYTAATCHLAWNPRAPNRRVKAIRCRALNRLPSRMPTPGSPAASISASPPKQVWSLVNKWVITCSSPRCFRALLCAEYAPCRSRSLHPSRRKFVPPLTLARCASRIAQGLAL